MVAGEGVRIEGLERASLMLQRLGNVLPAEIRQVLTESAQPAASALQGRLARRSGKLASTVRVRAKDRGRGIGVALVMGGRRAPYAGVYSFGRKARGRSGSIRRLTPNPAIVRVGEEQAEPTRRRVVSRMQSLINKVFID